MTPLGPKTAVAAALVLVVAAACAREKGEGQVAWLQGSMESEFPDRDSPIALDATHAAQLNSVAPLAPAPPSVATPKVPVASPVRDVPAEAVAPVAASAAPDDDINLRIRAHGQAVETLAGATPPDSPGVDPVAQQELDRGVQSLHAGQLDHARETFSAFLARWPDHPGAETALAGLADAYLAKGELLDAADTYGSVLARFPHGAKVADSLLGLGLAAHRLGREDKAMRAFERLALEFPKSDACRRIPRDEAAHLTQRP
jgi:TolA-binding protein